MGGMELGLRVKPDSSELGMRTGGLGLGLGVLRRDRFEVGTRQWLSKVCRARSITSK